MTGFDDMSMKSMKEVKETFDKYDTDGSGDIDIGELKEAVAGINGVASSSLSPVMVRPSII